MSGATEAPSGTKTVLITGAATGFGRLAAVRLAARGHRVMAGCQDADQAAELAAAHPEITTIELDITDPGAVLRVTDLELDVLVANAAMGQTGPLTSIPIDRVRRVFEVNVFGTLAVCQAAAVGMKRRRSGRILIVSSIAGVRAGVGSGPYAMTKHAVQAMGTSMRAELAAYGIDVALINPGPYATGFNDRMVDHPGDWFDPATADPEEVAVMESLRSRITIGQFEPDEVADRYVELVEADTTELVNFVPADLLERLAAR